MMLWARGGRWASPHPGIQPEWESTTQGRSRHFRFCLVALRRKCYRGKLKREAFHSRTVREHQWFQNVHGAIWPSLQISPQKNRTIHGSHSRIHHKEPPAVVRWKFWSIKWATRPLSDYRWQAEDWRRLKSCVWNGDLVARCNLSWRAISPTLPRLLVTPPAVTSIWRNSLLARCGVMHGRIFLIGPVGLSPPLCLSIVLIEGIGSSDRIPRHGRCVRLRANLC